MVVKVGDHGAAATAANRALMGHNVFRKQTLFHSQDHRYTSESERAARDMKWFLGYPVANIDGNFGVTIRKLLNGQQNLSLQQHLRRFRRKYEKKRYINPILGHYRLIGWPGIGTHSWIQTPNNWESDNACDAGCNIGTPLVAVAAGVIGPAFGPLDDHSGSGRFHGIRLHLEVPRYGNEFYYAHLSNTAPGIRPGAHVTQGQLLGHSGVANGVEHLHIGEENGNPVTDLFGGEL